MLVAPVTNSVSSGKFPADDGAFGRLSTTLCGFTAELRLHGRVLMAPLALGEEFSDLVGAGVGQSFPRMVVTTGRAWVRMAQ